MKVFVAGASGAIGRRLVPFLVADGHHVVATTRNSGKISTLRSMGAEPVILDGLNRDAVMQAVLSSRPEVIVHQMTALASMRTLKKFDEEFAITNRLRTEGTEHLIAAAIAGGVRKIVVQSFSGWTNARHGSRIKTEDDALDTDPPKSMRKSFQAIQALEQMVGSAAGLVGTVLRYGSLYGPSTSLSSSGEMVRMVRRREFPVIGSGAGVWSFIHVDDAAKATRLAIDGDVPGIFNIVDDEPAEVSVWLPALAEFIGAKPPRHLPVFMGRWFVGEPGVSIMTMIRGSSNAKAKRLLGWKPVYSSWREGFRRIQEDDLMHSGSQHVPANERAQ